MKKKVSWESTFFAGPSGAVKATELREAMVSFRKCGDPIKGDLLYYGPFASEAEANDLDNWNEDAGLCSVDIDYEGLE